MNREEHLMTVIKENKVRVDRIFSAVNFGLEMLLKETK